MKAKPKACEKCPAFTKGIGFCTPEQRTSQPDYTFILDGPGEQEATVGDPMFHNSLAGRQLKSMIQEAGIPWEEVGYTNIIWCWLPARSRGQVNEGVRSPTKAEAAYCMEHHLLPHLKKTGAFADGKAIITVGNTSARIFRRIAGSVEPHIGVFEHISNSEW